MPPVRRVTPGMGDESGKKKEKIEKPGEFKQFVEGKGDTGEGGQGEHERKIVPLEEQKKQAAKSPSPWEPEPPKAESKTVKAGPDQKTVQKSIQPPSGEEFPSLETTSPPKPQIMSTPSSSPLEPSRERSAKQQPKSEEAQKIWPFPAKDETFIPTPTIGPFNVAFLPPQDILEKILPQGLLEQAKELYREQVQSLQAKEQPPVNLSGQSILYFQQLLQVLNPSQKEELIHELSQMKVWAQQNLNPEQRAQLSVHVGDLQEALLSQKAITPDQQLFLYTQELVHILTPQQTEQMTRQLVTGMPVQAQVISIPDNILSQIIPKPTLRKAEQNFQKQLQTLQASNQPIPAKPAQVLMYYTQLQSVLSPGQKNQFTQVLQQMKTWAEQNLSPAQKTEITQEIKAQEKILPALKTAPASEKLFIYFQTLQQVITPEQTSQMLTSLRLQPEAPAERPIATIGPFNAQFVPPQKVLAQIIPQPVLKEVERAYQKELQVLQTQGNPPKNLSEQSLIYFQKLEEKLTPQQKTQVSQTLQAVKTWSERIMTPEQRTQLALELKEIQTDLPSLKITPDEQLFLYSQALQQVLTPQQTQALVSTVLPKTPQTVPRERERERAAPVQQAPTRGKAEAAPQAPIRGKAEAAPQRRPAETAPPTRVVATTGPFNARFIPPQTILSQVIPQPTLREALQLYQREVQVLQTAGKPPENIPQQSRIYFQQLTAVITPAQKNELVQTFQDIREWAEVNLTPEQRSQINTQISQVQQDLPNQTWRGDDEQLFFYSQEVQRVITPRQSDQLMEVLSDKAQKREEAALPEGAVPTPAPAPFDMSIGPVTTTPATLTPEVQEIFERMVGVMTIMTNSGITETSIHLTSPQFASSVFYGTQIIITEYSTAPKQFNIQFNVTPEAMQVLQPNLSDLVAGFQAGNYNFKVNRVETNLVQGIPRPGRAEEGGETEEEGGAAGEGREQRR